MLCTNDITIKTCTFNAKAFHIFLHKAQIAFYNFQYYNPKLQVFLIELITTVN